MFSTENSAWSKTTVTLCTNLAHICNISLVVSYIAASEMTLPDARTRESMLWALQPAAEHLFRYHSEEESDWLYGESETELEKQLKLNKKDKHACRVGIIG